MWNLPTYVKIDDIEYAIRNKCDYRVVLDVIAALNDNELEIENRIECALFIFYENSEELTNIDVAIKEMFKIINGGEEEEPDNQNKPQLMDWEKDFKNIAPPVSRILGYDVRTPDKYTHWWTFLGGYMEIGECTFSNIISIRSKKQKGKKLEAWEEEFYKENYKIIDLDTKFDKEEQDFLDDLLGLNFE